MKKLLILVLSLIALNSFGQNNTAKWFYFQPYDTTQNLFTTKNGIAYYNITTNKFVFYENGAYKHLGGSGGGGITNSAANNELGKSNGTNIVGSGIFTSSLGNYYFGTGLAGSARAFIADGSASNVDLNFLSKGIGTISINSSGSPTGTFIYGAPIQVVSQGSYLSLNTSSSGAAAGPNLTIGAGNGGSGNQDGGDVLINSGLHSGSGNDGAVKIQSTGTKLSFFNATPVVKQSAVTTSQGIVDALTAYGLIPSSTISGGSSGYSTVQNQGSSLTQRANLNFSTGFTAVDNSGSTRTDVTNNLLTGLSGGQTVIGGTGSGENLTLSSTSNSTKGSVIPDAKILFNYSSSTSGNYNFLTMKTFGSGTKYNGGGYIIVNAFGSGYTTGSYNNVTFTYTSGTVATNVVLTGITVSGGIATSPPYFYWVSGGVGADATTIWTASGIPGGSGFTVKLAATDYRSTQGDFQLGITQAFQNGDNQYDNVMFQGYNTGGGSRVNTDEAGISINLEDHFLASGNFGQFEYYLQVFGRDGSIKRPFAVNVDKQTGGATWLFRGDTYNFFTNAGVDNLDINTSTGSFSLQGSSPGFTLTNTTSGGGVFLVLPQAGGGVNIRNNSSTAFPGNYMDLGNNRITIGSPTGSANDSPKDLFQINSTSTQTGFANMSINALTASRSAALAFTQGAGDGSANNRMIAIGLDGNQSDNFYGLSGSSNNLLFRFWDGSTFRTAMSVYLSSGIVGQQSELIQTTSTATAAGTTTLTNQSNGIQIFTGSTTQTVTLPIVTTFPANGFMFRVVNLSSGIVTVQTSGANTIKALAANSFIDLWVKDTTAGTGTASWNWFYNASLNN